MIHKMVVLMEDTCGAGKCIAEHGFSLYIETEKHHLLMDTGASDKTLINAQLLSVDLSKVDTIVLSHGHYDHSGGMLAIAKMCPEAKIYMQHSAADAYYHGERYIGIAPEIEELPGVCLLGESDSAYEIDEELTLFSGISGRRFWPKSNLVLSRLEGERLVQDDFLHEQCLVIDKKILITGCAHNGILNILDRFRELYGDNPETVITGFHMMKKTDYDAEEIDIIRKTAEELASMNTVFYTGHCTGQKAYDLMKQVMGDKLRLVHSGTEIFKNFT